VVWGYFARSRSTGSSFKLIELFFFLTNWCLFDYLISSSTFSFRCWLVKLEAVVAKLFFGDCVTGVMGVCLPPVPKSLYWYLFGIYLVTVTLAASLSSLTLS
jgi:hypothetical protein